MAAKYKLYYNVGSDCTQTHWTYELEEDNIMEECDTCYTCLCFSQYQDVGATSMERSSFKVHKYVPLVGDKTGC